MALEYLGVSEKYSLQADSKGKVALISGVDNIKQSIHDILATPIGTRFYNEYYGSYLEDLVFEPNDAILKSLLFTGVITALRNWEKRINVIDVPITLGLEKCDLFILYQVLSSNEIDSFIYPFYREIKQ